MADHPLAPIWPPARLRVTTPRLELRLATDEEIVRLFDVVKGGVHDPETMPFSQPWTDYPHDELARRGYQWNAQCRASWTPERWNLHLAAFVGDDIIGAQDIGAERFGVLREVASGSWIAQRWQGQGLGTQMRQAMLHLAFDGLGALSAISSAAGHNAASQRVSAKAGYSEDGVETVVNSRGPSAPGGESKERITSIRYRIERESWLERRRDDVVIHGLDNDLLTMCGVSSTDN